MRANEMLNLGSMHWLMNDRLIDDVRDIYRRAEREELVVEGLREGTNLVGGDE